jgi:CRISPR-associated endonuclease/helicase Cas3
MDMRPARLVAHTPPASGGDWHNLDDHSLAVAKMAAEFAEPFGAQDVARWLGLLHDAGKAHPDFQEYLWTCFCEPDRKHPTVDHKSAGAFLLQSARDVPQVLLGHHGGLSDLGDVNVRIRHLNQNLRERMMDAWKRFESMGIALPQAPQPTPEWARKSKLSHEFYLRMLFSCLVDADALDTEAHWNRDEADIRSADSPSLVDLWTRFETDQAELIARVNAGAQAASPVNRVRAEVYDTCIQRASLPPGFFRLTVPTGGGKTRASTAFALKHALANRLDRIIFAVPFLTITDQTVDVLRQAVGSDRAVLEHHSGIEPIAESASGEETADERWRQLVSDNWDAPIVVTTTVQLFESLLGRKTRQCRKLHNIPRSVIILDEFQTIPAHMRAPIFDVLRELVTNYGASVVLCTATQPVLDTIEVELKAHGVRVTELAPDPVKAFTVLERVRYAWPDADDPWTWERVADEIRDTEQSLTIVNTVRDASTLFQVLDDPDAFHLSTRMCGAHRRDVLRTIRARLRDGAPCRVVSTQLVEAGVDLDFPLVLRAIAPLDRIAQAAGRCNREGRMPEKGDVVVFSLEDDAMPGGAYQHGAGITRGMLREGLVNVNDPATFDTYFRRLYADRDADTREIQHYRAGRAYEEVASRFRMIDDDTFPVVVRYTSPATEALNHLMDASRWPGTSLRDAFRAIQPYVVSCRSYERGRFEEAGVIEEIRSGLWIWSGEYDDKLGLADSRALTPAETRINPVALFI